MSSTIRHIEHCPSCGTNVEGKPQLESYRQATKIGATIGIKKYITGAIVSPIVGTLIVPAVGTFFGFIITFIILLKVHSYANKLSEELDKQLFRNTKYLFTCPSCGNTWTRTFDTGISEIPVGILRKEYTATLEDLSKSRHSNGLAALICGVIFLIGLIYCMTNEPSTVIGQTHTWFGTLDQREWHWGWYIWAFICTVTFVVGCVYGYLWKKNMEDYAKFESKLNNLPVSDDIQVRLTSGQPVIVTRPRTPVQPVIEQQHPIRAAIEQSRAENANIQQTKTCPYCGEQIPIHAIKCKWCGETLPVEKKKMQCPICGELVDEGTKVCPYCHEDISNL